MHSIKQGIIPVFLLIAAGQILSTSLSAHEPPHRVESHHIAETSNSAQLDLTFNQTNIAENYRIEFYNSNSESPVLVLNLREHEHLTHPSPNAAALNGNLPTLDTSVEKSFFFYPTVLSEKRTSQKIQFNYIKPPRFTSRVDSWQDYQQHPVDYHVGVTWGNTDLVITFGQNGYKPQQIDLTGWARKLKIPLDHVPQISRIDVFAEHHNAVVTMKSKFGFAEFCDLNVPFCNAAVSIDKDTLITPDIHWPTEIKSQRTSLLHTLENIHKDGSSLIYLLTPSMNEMIANELKELTRSIYWVTTTPGQDEIYFEGQQIARRKLTPSNNLVTIDEQNHDIIWPMVGKVLNRNIILRPKHSSSGKHWRILTTMNSNMEVANTICQYEHGQKECHGFSLSPVRFENQFVFLTRDENKNIKAWLGANEREQINLTEKFPDLAEVEEFEFSQRFDEFRYSDEARAYFLVRE